MSNVLLTATWKVAGVTGIEKLVLARLADRADDSGRCWPGQESIARDCSVTSRTVRNAIPKLVSLGLLEIERPPSFRGTQVYRLTLRPPEPHSGPENGSASETVSTPEGASTPESLSTSAGMEFRTTGTPFLTDRNGIPANPQGTVTEPPPNPNPSVGTHGSVAKATKQEPELVPLTGNPLPKADGNKPARVEVAKTQSATSPWLLDHGVELPGNLRTDACLDAARLWLAHKRERRNGYKPIGLRGWASEMGNTYTAETFPIAVRFSIASNYKGVYAPRNLTPGQGLNTARQRSDGRYAGSTGRDENF